MNTSSLQQALIAAEEWLRKEYSQISTGRANPSLLDSVMVEQYGTFTPLKNMAAISIEDARTLRISPWDKSAIGAIEKAVHTSGLPFSLAVDSAGLRAHIPQLTEESRKSIVKLAKDKLEDARVTVRQERQAVDKEIGASSSSDDEKKRDREIMQKMVDATNQNLEVIYKTKETDIMSV